MDKRNILNMMMDYFDGKLPDYKADLLKVELNNYPSLKRDFYRYEKTIDIFKDTISEEKVPEADTDKIMDFISSNISQPKETFFDKIKNFLNVVGNWILNIKLTPKTVAASAAFLILFACSIIFLVRAEKYKSYAQKVESNQQITNAEFKNDSLVYKRGNDKEITLKL